MVAQTSDEAQAQDNCGMLAKVESSNPAVKFTGLYKGERKYFRCCAWGEWSGCHARFWYSYLTPTTPTTAAAAEIEATVSTTESEQ